MNTLGSREQKRLQIPFNFCHGDPAIVVVFGRRLQHGNVGGLSSIMMSKYRVYVPPEVCDWHNS